MTLAVYPLVYLPVAASLRSADPGQEEVARSLGLGRVQTFLRITLGQARGAILGGCLLVALVHPRRVRRLRDPRLPDLHDRDLHRVQIAFSVPAACALSLVLVRLEPRRPGRRGPCRGRARVSRSGPMAQRAAAAAARPGQVPGAGRASRWSACWRWACPSAPASTGLFARRGHSVAGVSLLRAAMHTAVYSGARPRLATVHGPARRAAGAAASADAVTAAARAQHLPRARDARGRDRVRALVLHRAVRGRLPATRPRRCWSSPTRSCSSRSRWWAYGRRWPSAPASLEEVARSLGRRRLAVFWRVTLPLGAGPRRRVLPGVPVGGDGAHRDAAADPDRRADASPRSSGPTSRTCPTGRRPRSRWS